MRADSRPRCLILVQPRPGCTCAGDAFCGLQSARSSIKVDNKPIPGVNVLCELLPASRAVCPWAKLRSAGLDRCYPIGLCAGNTTSLRVIVTSLPSLFELVNPLEKQGTRLRAGCGYRRLLVSLRQSLPRSLLGRLVLRRI